MKLYFLAFLAFLSSIALISIALISSLFGFLVEPLLAFAFEAGTLLFLLEDEDEDDSPLELFMASGERAREKRKKEARVRNGTTKVDEAMSTLDTHLQFSS